MVSMSVTPKIDLPATPDDRQVSVQDENRAKLRRQMYERIATGNALAEAEASARQRWQSGSSE